MKKIFLLFAFIIAAVCTAPLEAMNKRDRAETKEDDRRVATETKQTKIGNYFLPLAHPGIPTPNLAAAAARNNVQDDTPPAPVPNKVRPANTWWHGRVAAQQINQ